MAGDLPRWIRIEAGHQYSPTGRGRLTAVLEPDGSVTVTRRWVQMAPETWVGRVPPAAMAMLAEALESAGFPNVPDTGGALLPDEAASTFTVRRRWWREESAGVTHRTSNIPGYRQALRIFDAICHVATGGQHGHLPPELRWLEGEEVRHDHPRVGQDIYLPSERYLSRGEDDFAGGRCQVVAVTLGESAGQPTAFVEVAEQPGVKHNWQHLAPMQDKLRAEFGDRRGHPDPDHRPEFNESITDQLIAEGEYHRVPVTWRATDRPDTLATEWGGKKWELRIDRSSNTPYQLVIDGTDVVAYAVLPRAWRVPG